ncbi:hypothetical protein M0802_010332 [Mischocyttarus mexicanus]|nr:hypothetical protein M0802_010332 [Mischocyttarus mexicanus]
MNNEENRLRTFSSWPSHAPISAERMAKAGFYYTGVGLEVQCFLCGVKITEWNYSDVAIVRHRNAAPDCPFVLNPSITCNEPLVLPSNENRESLLNDRSSIDRTNQGESLLSTRSSSCRVNRSTPLTDEEIDINHRTIENRLSTFTNWPIPEIVSPQKLAEAGFIYLQNRDVVVCVFCRGIIYDWKLGSDPDKEHRTHFPTCDFYERSHIDITQLTNVNIISGSTTNLENIGINTHTQPRNPSQSSYETRLRTYIHWPTNISQTPEQLAKAGFYYIGFKDYVRCYHCDGGLHYWDNTDDPWVEHAKWFPKCGFVSLLKGQQFIQECVAMRGCVAPADRMNPFSFNRNNDISITEVPEDNNTVTITEETESDTATVIEETEEIEGNTVIITEETEAPYGTELPILFLTISVTEAIEALSITEVTPATEASSVTEEIATTEAIPATEASSVTEEIVTTEAPTAGEVISTTEIPSALEPYLRTIQNAQSINYEFFEDLINKTIPEQSTAEANLSREEVKTAMRNYMETTGLNYNRTIQFMQNIIESIEESTGAEGLNLNMGDVTQPRLNEISEVSNDNTSNNITSLTINRESSEMEESPISPQAAETSDSNDKLAEKETNTDLNESSSSLEEENRKLKEARICKVCMDNEIAVVFLPCGHLATCDQCAPSLVCCPIYIINHLPKTVKDSGIVGGLPPLSTLKSVDEVDNVNYRFESERLRSFRNWPVSFLKPEKLAEAGFYYLGEGDKVKCFECNIEICQWVENDDPMEDHARWSDRCRFIKKEPCGNIPLGADPNVIPQLRASIDICGIYNHNGDNDTLTKELQLLSTAKLSAMGLGRMKGPTHPDYASYDARLKSFNSWPRSMPHSKELLAHAGYYYSGNGDQTLCYHCGGGLKDWENGDDPWVEHAKWFPKCTYLLMVKGQEYVNKVTGQQMTPSSPEDTLHMNLPSFIKTMEPLSSFECSQSVQAENTPGPSKATIEVKGSSTSVKAKGCKNLGFSEAHCSKFDDARLCKICYNRELGIVFLPCGHIVACVNCAPEMTICAVCRVHVTMKVRAFFS